MVWKQRQWDGLLNRLHVNASWLGDSARCGQQNHGHQQGVKVAGQV
tara:strand:- start:435 stop:572 length:138 start_codon:yes stop_codon:yes gene_type:complete